MGFNNCHIPNYERLIEYYNSVDLETFIKSFRKYDSWSGDSDSFKFLESKIQEYEQNISNNTDINGGIV
jgi:glycogen debranching enzyme